MLFKNKKGIEFTFTAVVVGILVISVMVIVLLFFGKFFGLEVGILTPTITGLQCDYDQDGVKDSIDVCPCDIDPSHQIANQCNTLYKTGKPCQDVVASECNNKK